jgi:hypothetical protein
VRPAALARRLLPGDRPARAATGRSCTPGLLYRPEDFGAAVHFTHAASPRASSATCRRRARVRARTSRRTRGRRLRSSGSSTSAPRLGRDGTVRWTGTLTVAAAVAARKSRDERENEVERSRLEMMRATPSTPGCRRSFLLSYFGPELLGPLRQLRQRTPSAADAQLHGGSSPSPLGERVVSERWGRGDRPALRRRALTVSFDDHGYREPARAARRRAAVTPPRA